MLCMLEGKYKTQLCERIREMLPGCTIVKNDAAYMQGIPDLTIFYKDKWAMLEVKVSPTAKRQPNQEYYVDFFDKMSFAAFIFPENEEEVLNDLQRSLQARRSTRVSQR